MSEEDEELKEAWRAFCEKLSDAGNSIIDSKTLGTDTDRVEGLRHLLRALYNLPLESSQKVAGSKIDTCPLR